MQRRPNDLHRRLARLEARHKNETSSEYQSRIDRMSDEELYLEVYAMLAEVGGSIRDYASAEAFLEATEKALPWPGTMELYLPGLREQYHCMSWFDVHEGHGAIRLVKTSHWVQPKFVHRGPGVTATCACGDSINVLDVFVPVNQRARIERAAD